MDDCLFCKIVKGEVPSLKIHENDEFMAFLDIFPNTIGQSLVIPKKHFSSDVSEMPVSEYNNFFSYAREIVELLKKKLGVFKVAMVVEGMGVNHAHIKLYPLIGVSKEFQEIHNPERVFFERYNGFITTKTGPPGQNLKLIHEKITST